MRKMTKKRRKSEAIFKGLLGQDQHLNITDDQHLMNSQWYYFCILFMRSHIHNTHTQHTHTTHTQQTHTTHPHNTHNTYTTHTQHIHNTYTTHLHNTHTTQHIQHIHTHISYLTSLSRRLFCSKSIVPRILSDSQGRIDANIFVGCNCNQHGMARQIVRYLK